MPKKSSPVAAPYLADAIAERAYFKALNRGFAPGFELDDWLEAEREVATLTASVPKARPKRNTAASKSKSKKV